MIAKSRRQHLPPAGLDRRLVCARRDVPSWARVHHQRPASAPVRRVLGRRHHLVLGRSTVPGGWAECVDWPGQPPLRARAGREALYPSFRPVGPHHTTTISATASEAPYLVDGLLYHETDLEIAEHYSDTGAFSDQIFGICQLLGFRYAPRIRDLADKRLHPFEKASAYPTLEPLIGDRVNVRQIESQWEELLRLATSIRQGTVTASLVLRKLASYPRQNGLAWGLREIGRIDRTLFTLDWLHSPELRRRVTVGLNKGKAKNALSRAVCFHRRGMVQDRTFDDQRLRAGGLNLVVAAIVLWNTVYLERAVETLRAGGTAAPDELLQHLSPLAWEHIILTGEYRWGSDETRQPGQRRELRPARRRAHTGPPTGYRTKFPKRCRDPRYSSTDNVPAPPCRGSCAISWFPTGTPGRDSRRIVGRRAG